MAEPQQPSPDSFGPNVWLVDEMFEEFRRDPLSVSTSWREFFEGYKPGGANLARPEVASVEEAAEIAEPVAARSPVAAGSAVVPAGAAGAGTAVAGAAGAGTAVAGAEGAGAGERDGSTTVPLRGGAARAVANMTTSLQVPTATSFRVVPSKLLEVNRTVLNDHLVRAGVAGKVSFTHLIGWAVVQALKVVPSLNSSFTEALPSPGTDGQGETDGRAPQPAVLRPAHVNLGIAVDLERRDGSRALMVPVIKKADGLDFRGFWLAYEEMVRKVRTGKVEVSDFAGTTITLTNPGTLGTVQSVPRLLAGQGAIIGVGTYRLPCGMAGGRPPSAGRARCLQSRHGQFHVRPPGDTGR